MNDILSFFFSLVGCDVCLSYVSVILLFESLKLNLGGLLTR